MHLDSYIQMVIIQTDPTDNLQQKHSTQCVLLFHLLLKVEMNGATIPTTFNYYAAEEKA